MRRLPAFVVAAALGAAVFATPSAAEQQRAPTCECQPGYYHRRADADDLMCVTRSSRNRIQVENAEAGAYTNTDGYCLSGWVFRDAFDGDGVCVFPEDRDRVHAENRDPMRYADPLCYLGLYDSDANPNDD